MGRLLPPFVEAGMMAAIAQPSVEVDDEIVLRPFEDRPDDVAAVVAAFSDPDIQRYHLRHLDEAEARAWIADQTDSWSSERGATWAVVGRADAQVLGRVTIYTDLAAGTGEVAYWMLPRARGRGVATRACVAATAWAHEFGLHRVRLEHSTTNDGSRRVAEAAGFVREGVKRQATRHQDG